MQDLCTHVGGGRWEVGALEGAAEDQSITDMGCRQPIFFSKMPLSWQDEVVIYSMWETIVPTKGKELFQLTHLKDFMQVKHMLHRERLQDFYVQSKSSLGSSSCDCFRQDRKKERRRTGDYHEGIKPQQGEAS